MAKPATPGRVKTRLIGNTLDAGQAAAVHQAMLDCVLERVASWLPGGRRVLALAGAGGAHGGAAAPGWEVVDQGEGDLGARLLHVWAAVGGGAVAFLGVDSPDVPGEALRALGGSVTRSAAAAGPTEDGGYWTLAARELNASLVTRIDWGTPKVYDQTRAAAARAGLTFETLPPWDDVDTASDLARLRARLEVAAEPPLVRLRDRLRAILKDPPQ